MVLASTLILQGPLMLALVMTLFAGSIESSLWGHLTATSEAKVVLWRTSVTVNVAPVVERVYTVTLHSSPG